MFTGIVEATGSVIDLTRNGIRISAPSITTGATLGESVAVNGVCLTMSSVGDGWFGCDLMPETLRLTNLGALHAGTTVNLERPVQPSSRMGGHIVQGHIDGTGRVASVTPDDDAVVVQFEVNPGLMRYIVTKGFIAVDGASLTVVDRTNTGFRVSLVRYTLDHTVFGHWKPGDVVNIEVDILAKYVEQLVAGSTSTAGRSTL